MTDPQREPVEPTLANARQGSRLEDPTPPQPRSNTNAFDRALREPIKEEQARPKTPRRWTELSCAEVRLLQAWKALRATNPWQQPTVSELAHVLGVAPQTVYRSIGNLVRKGVLVRTTQSKRAARVYALTPEAAARPQLAALVRLATDIVKLPPGAVHDDDGPEQYAALWARARSVVQEIVLLATHQQRRTLRRVTHDAQRRGETAAPAESQ